jgi:hypothetical protein
MPTPAQIRARKFNWNKARLINAAGTVATIRMNLQHDGKISTKLNTALNHAQINLVSALKLWESVVYKKGKIYAKR